MYLAVWVDRKNIDFSNSEVVLTKFSQGNIYKRISEYMSVF